MAYFLLITLYTGFGVYTMNFQITKGVEVIQTIQPEWEGTESGLLWPWIMYATGFVDENDEPAFFEGFGQQESNSSRPVDNANNNGNVEDRVIEF